MTPNPQTVGPNLSVRQAFFKMRVEGLRHLLVLKEDELLGILSDRDLRRPDVTEDPDGWDEFYRLDEDYEVCDVMTTELITVSAQESLERALKIVIKHRFNALPVLDKKDNLIGILTSHDLLRAFEELMKEAKASRLIE